MFLLPTSYIKNMANPPQIGTSRREAVIDEYRQDIENRAM
jgi:hypothetical protein